MERGMLEKRNTNGKHYTVGIAGIPRNRKMQHALIEHGMLEKRNPNEKHKGFCDFCSVNQNDWKTEKCRKTTKMIGKQKFIKKTLEVFHFHIIIFPRLTN